MKDNCMDCHQIGATQGAFTIAGTVFMPDQSNKNPNGTIYLHTLRNGKDSIDEKGNVFEKDSIIATIEVDGVGNFYTTHPYDLHNGVYPEIVTASSDTMMQTIAPNGACNSCHNANPPKISVR